MNRFLTSTSIYGLMRPEDGAGSAAAADDTAAAAAAGQADDNQGADAGGDNGAAAAADATAAAPAADAGDKGTPPPEPAKPGAKAPKWAMDRIAEETNKRREAAAELERERQRALALEQLVEHMKKGSGGTDAAAQQQAIETAAARVAAPVDPKKYEADVLTAAERLRFNDDCNAIFQSGSSEFKDFEDAVKTLNNANVMQDDFIMDVLAADRANAHKVIHELAQDPEKAIRLARLPQRQRLAELVRLTAVSGKPAPKRETNAPAPIKGAVQSIASQDEGDLGDEVSDDVWSQRFDKKYMGARA